VKTSREICRKAKVSPRTLRLWSALGIIPRPHVEPRPTGRGRHGQFPDAVLERVKKIAALERQGIPLREAVARLEAERVVALLDTGKSIAANLARVEVKVGAQTFTLLELFEREVAWNAYQRFGQAVGVALEEKLHAAKGLDRAQRLLAAGFNPVLVFNGEAVRVVPDFLVAHILEQDSTSLVVPLKAPMRRAFAKAGIATPETHRAHPAEVLWLRDGDVTVEVPFVLAGPLGFELVEELAKVIFKKE
jgi:DNA-binding transcriptional MerR regulator